jgi:branched-chain amino acid transport system ATP-binding protein
LASRTDPILRAERLSARYGQIVSLRETDIEVSRGEVVAILGANGAGKTTLLNTLSGFCTIASGRVYLEERPISGWPPHKIVAAGLIQISQERSLFSHMTVADNLRLGAARRGRRRLDENMAHVFGLFPRLAERQDQKAGTLSGGEQQMLAIGRAIMGEPVVLLLDEPSAGLAPKFVEEITAIIGRLKAAGTTMLLVEQNLGLPLAVADRFYVLREGRNVATGAIASIGMTPLQFAEKYYL